MIKPMVRVLDYNIFTEIFISDLHFGVMNPKIQYEILKEQFLFKIENLDFDILTITGDIFDRKFMGNSDAIMYATLFINDVVNLCVLKNATLILIRGTESHEAGQLKLFYHYLDNPNIDIRIVETVKFEYVRGKRILCIPELYGMGFDYYANFLFYSGLYDSVYMHGTYKGTIYGKDTADLDSKREPVFDMSHFANCKGPIISGHNHVPGCHDEHFYSCGSPYRWCFGEEHDKGFMILVHNVESRSYNAHYEWIQSFRYDTINLDHMLGEDPAVIINYITELQKNGIDNLRVEFTLNKEETLLLVRNCFRNHPNIKIKSDTVQQKILRETEEARKKDEELGFMYDPNLSPEAKLVEFINYNMGYAYMTVEELLELLKED